MPTRYDRVKLPAWLDANKPGWRETNSGIRLEDDGAGPWIAEWNEQQHGSLPTVEEVNAFQPDPIPGIAEQYAGAYQAAEAIIFELMARVSLALVASGAFNSGNVNTEGTRFVKFHRDLILDFKNAGRHPNAGEDLYQAIASAPSLSAFTWLAANNGAILNLFATGLPRTGA